MRVDFTHCAAQTEAFRAFGPGRRVCNAWGRGVGKSWFDRVVMYLLVAEWEGRVRVNKELGETYRGVRIALVLPTMAQFQRIGYARALRNDLAKRGPWGFLGAEFNLSNWTIDFPGGSTIQVVSAENSEVYRGIRCDAIIIDEADDVDISAFEAIFLPWTTEPVSLRQILISGTPKRGRFGLLWRAFSVWPYGDADHDPIEGAVSTHATGYDCPAIVSRELLEEERRNTSPDRFDREYLCNFDSGEGLVYPYFYTSFHVRQPVAWSEFHSYIVGLDYGFNDPTAIVVIGICGYGRDTVCHVVREWYAYGKSATQIAEIASEVERSFPGARWYADHSPVVSKQIEDDTPVRITPALKGPDSVENGVSFIADALLIRELEGVRWAQLYVDPSCKHTVEEFGLYRRKRDTRDKERILDVIDSSGNDHCLDALRYALTTHFGGPDRRLRLG